MNPNSTSCLREYRVYTVRNVILCSQGTLFQISFRFWETFRRRPSVFTCTSFRWDQHRALWKRWVLALCPLIRVLCESTSTPPRLSLVYPIWAFAWFFWSAGESSGSSLSIWSHTRAQFHPVPQPLFWWRGSREIFLCLPKKWGTFRANFHFYCPSNIKATF